MIIKANGKEFIVSELAEKWKIERSVGGVSVVYEVPKESARNAEELARYIEENKNIF